MAPCLCIISGTMRMRLWMVCMLHYNVYIIVFITNYFTGENKSYYVISPATVRHAGHYYCQVKDQYGVKDSATAMVTVSTSPKTNIPSGTPGFSYSQLPLKGLASQIQHSVSTNLES